MSQTLAEHWDGTRWSIVSTPSPGTGSDFLNQAAALASNDVWAVGSRDNTTASEGPGSHTLIEHWDGTAWQVVPSPNPGDAQNILRGIAAISPTDIWVGGHFKSKQSARQTLIEHWDGSTWSVVSSPNASSENNGIMRMAAVSASDVWAVGNFNQGGTPHTLTEHWDGVGLKVVSSPNPGVGGAYPEGTLLWSVATVSVGDVWASGQYFDGTVVRTLTEHWDGSSWSVVPSPNASGGENQLRGLQALTADDIWAVGWAQGSPAFRTLIEHWDGSSWSVVASPNVGTGDNFLKTTAGVSANNVWAVGYLTSGGIYQTLIEHWDGSSWSVVPSPNVGGTPSVPSAPSLSATASSGLVHLSWTVPSDGGSPITGYRLYRGTASDGESLYASVGNVTSFDDTAVVGGTSYFYQVSAVNAVGESARSNEVSATPSALSGIRLSATGYKVKGLQKVDLTWSGAASMNVDVFRRGTLIATTANDGSYTDNINKKGSATYTYLVCEADTATCSNQATVVF